MAAPNLAIYYHPDGFDTKNRPLMGRRAAGKAFLDAWFDRRSGGETYCLAARQQDFEHFVTHAKSRNVTGQARWLRLERLETVAQAGTLYFPGPDIAANDWRRHRRDPKGFSIIGVTHTICTKAVMDGISEWLTSPAESWDAVICTSQSVRLSVDYALAAEREFLARRTGATRFPQPQLPVIPLGINTKEFAADEAQRNAMRAKLGISDDEVAFLFVGRLSIYGKTHPVPMFTALQRAAQRTGRKLHLILAGWYATKGLEKSFADHATHWCPDVKVHNVDGRDDAARNGAWRAGDVFVSLVDNVQETFGLTPVEAMAAGLPVVVSDWDGYRDSVRHGVDGFRVPTLMTSGPFGEPLVDRYAADIDSYDMYLARTTYNVVVDVEATVEAFVKLIEDPALRQRMGEAGRARATADYDWQKILGLYEDLAGKLGEIRKGAPAPDDKHRRLWPARLSPFEMFANYTTRMPAAEDRIRVVVEDLEKALAGVAMDSNALIDNREMLMGNLRAMLGEIGLGDVTLSALLEKREPAQRGQAIATLMRLAKFGIVNIIPAPGAAGPRRGPADPAT